MTSATSCGWVHFGVAEVRRPVEISAHQLDNVRKARERLHRKIPVLIVDAGMVAFDDQRLVLVRPALRLDDLHGIGAHGQHLREQGVGIERDGRQQLFEFFAGERAVFGRLFGLARGLRRGGRRGRRLGWRWRRRWSWSWRRGRSWVLLSLSNQRVVDEGCRHSQSEQTMRALRAAADCSHHWRALVFPLSRTAAS